MKWMTALATQKIKILCEKIQLKVQSQWQMGKMIFEMQKVNEKIWNNKMVISKLLQTNKTSNPTEKYAIHWRNTIGLKNNWKDAPVRGKYHIKTEMWFSLLNLS